MPEVVHVAFGLDALVCSKLLTVRLSGLPATWELAFAHALPAGVPWGALCRRPACSGMWEGVDPGGCIQWEPTRPMLSVHSLRTCDKSTDSFNHA